MTNSNNIKSIDALLHPARNNQDLNCPEIQWMGTDLIHCPGIGEWKCKLKTEIYGDLLCGGGYENLDYKPCNCSNYQICKVYNKHHNSQKNK
ncbi:MAG: hypothetical protein KKA62_03585 [Nanoarchaeota archaeon]|nr:hypothetical protein [Nanoarchaeota archaeon]MBU1643781.1 hypothetical protein [Nanoarchaeota archaeon]MBU1977007.1 hypothetical protein [Nanoarchaeota archaeon]